jgi:glycosyltransferase involved in cell wall biosynthesis
MTLPLHIVIDARWIFKELSGIGLYTRELIKALVELESPHRFTLLFNDGDIMARVAAYTGFTTYSHFTGRLVGQGPLSPLDVWRLPRLLRKLKPDLYHSTNYTTPLLPAGTVRTVVTMYDLIPLLFRKYAPKSKKNRLFPLFKFLLHRAVNNSHLVISISESTRHDLIQHLLVPPASEEKIIVIPCGVRPEYLPAAREPHDDIVFLYVGRRDPYKNLPMLVESFAQLKKQNYPARLRVIGSDDPRYPEARQTARALGVDDAIEWCGYVHDSELIHAYQQADVFVLPSRYEGFGLPVAEAMACGTPVICSRSSSLPEVAAEATLYMDPDNPETLTAAMLRMVREPDLRVELSRRGLAQAAKFTWAETARMTIAAYERAAGKSS